MEELATRSFTATPENCELKIIAANVLTNLKASIPWQYNEETFAFKVIKQLVERLQAQASENKLDVIIPFLNLHELFPHEISRDMRDFQHFTQFLKTITLLHSFQRPYLKLNDSKFLICTVEDVRRALEVYKEIFETTRTGTEKRILDFYHDVVKTKGTWYLKSLTLAYNEKYRKKLSEESIRVMLERLDRIGYVNTQKDDEDKRKNLYVPLMKGEEKGKNPLESESWLNSEAKLKNGFKLWKENILDKTTFYIYKKISEEKGTWGESEASLEELDHLVLEGQKIFSSDTKLGLPRIISNEDLKPTKEIEPEINQTAISRGNLGNSTTQNKPSMLDSPGDNQKTVKTDVSEQTEVTEVSLEVLAKNTLKLERLTSHFEDRCFVCHADGRMGWQATFQDQTWGLLCDDCGAKLSELLEAGIHG